MKSSSIIILFLLPLYVFSQSVPNTNTFTLQDVIDAVNPTTNDLIDCFNDADSLYFDPTYNNNSYAPDSSMLRFRNYALTYECGTSASFSGVVSYPSYYRVSLGTATGNVSVTYDMHNMPDLLIIKYPNMIVVNTGYRGSSDYDYGNIHRGVFNGSLNGKIDPIWGGTLPNLTNYPDDGYPRVVGTGVGSTSFSKGSSTETLCHVYIYAPMGNTQWDVEVGCP